MPGRRNGVGLLARVAGRGSGKEWVFDRYRGNRKWRPLGNGSTLVNICNICLGNQLKY